MTKLEEEFDYETDLELIKRGRGILEPDLYNAIEYFVLTDPMRFVENIEHQI